MKFKFRMTLHYQEGDGKVDVAVWVDGLRSPQEQDGCNEWALNAMNDFDPWDELELDGNKLWQVCGEVRIESSYDCFGEYDESFDVLSFEVMEIDEAFFESVKEIRDQIDPGFVLPVSSIDEVAEAIKVDYRRCSDDPPAFISAEQMKEIIEAGEPMHEHRNTDGFPMKCVDWSGFEQPE